MHVGHEFVSLETCNHMTCVVDETKGGVPCAFQSRRNRFVFIKIAKFAKQVGDITFPLWEDFSSLHEREKPTDLSKYAFTVAIEVDFAIPSGVLNSFGVSCDARPNSCIECGVVQSSAQIVDAIAYYPRGFFMGEGLCLADFKDWARGLTFVLSNETIGVFFGERTDYPFKVSAMMLGPLKLESGAGENV